jgi:hypothetical protein
MQLNQEIGKDAGDIDHDQEQDGIVAPFGREGCPGLGSCSGDDPSLLYTIVIVVILLAMAAFPLSSANPARDAIPQKGGPSEPAGQDMGSRRGRE